LNWQGAVRESYLEEEGDETIFKANVPSILLKEIKWERYGKEVISVKISTVIGDEEEDEAWGEKKEFKKRFFLESREGFVFDFIDDFIDDMVDENVDHVNNIELRFAQFNVEKVVTRRVGAGTRRSSVATDESSTYTWRLSRKIEEEAIRYCR
jgi:hypothetical protein